MSLPIIIMGASGRMGATLINQVNNNPEFILSAVLEREEKLTLIKHLPCLCSSSPADVFSRFPGAVVIDFTAPEASIENARLAVVTGNPIIIGSTGFSESQKQELNELAKQGLIFCSPNMSIGINVLLEVLPKITKMLADYDVEILEMHHNLKKDSPSGTALRLGECIAEAREQKLSEVANYHRQGLGERTKNEIGMQTIRGGDIVGVHSVYYCGLGERIEIKHEAGSRDNFAKGALKAALWLSHKKPEKLYSMQDILHAELGEEPNLQNLFGLMPNA